MLRQIPELVLLLAKAAITLDSANRSRIWRVPPLDRLKPTHFKLQVLIVSYETFRMHHEKFKDASSCDLLICDEAHRLKNDQTLTNKVEAALTTAGVFPK